MGEVLSELSTILLLNTLPITLSYDTRINYKRVLHKFPNFSIHSLYIATADHPDAYRLSQQIKLGCETDRLATVLGQQQGHSSRHEWP